MDDIKLIDFKTVRLDSKVAPDIGESLQLKAESRVSANTSEDMKGYVCIYLSIKIHDDGDKFFVFDITTQSVIELPEGTEPDEELYSQCVVPAQERTFKAVREISAAMGINPIDLAKT